MHCIIKISGYYILYNVYGTLANFASGMYLDL